MSKRHRSQQPRQGLAQPKSVSSPPPIGASGALIDVVLSVYGEWAFAERAIASLPAAMQGINETYRVFVTDNGTPVWRNTEGQSIEPEAQAQSIKDSLRPVDRFTRLPDNVGFPAVYNKLVLQGTAPLVLILTSDVFLHPGAVTALVRAMDDPQVGVAGPLLIFPEGTKAGPAERVQHAGIAFDIRGKPIHQFIGWTPENPRVTRGSDVSAVTGACFLTRRSIWRAVGGFAEVYGQGTYEDVDYCFAVRAGGAKVLYVPEARGYHVVGGSFQAGANRRQFDLARNETIFQGRWGHMLAWDEWRRW